MAHRIEEMAKLGTFKGFEIMVFEGEGSIPHFHFRNFQDGRKGCIKLLTNEYFKHGEYQDELNVKERKELVNFLQSEPKEQYKRMFKEGFNNYDILCLLWDMNNDTDICSTNIIMPNYRNM